MKVIKADFETQKMMPSGGRQLFDAIVAVKNALKRAGTNKWENDGRMEEVTE